MREAVSEGSADMPLESPASVIFDFGGVLADMRWDVSAELERTHGLPRGALLETLYRTETWREVECGRGDLEAWRLEAHRLLEARARCALPRLHDAWLAARHLIPTNVALARRLRPAYRTAILSNADRTLRGRLCELGIHHLFDTVISSAEEGLAKPDPTIYRLAAERLGVPPDACVFVDDYDVNVRAAETVGMRGILYRVDRDPDLLELLAAAGVALP
jgi:putative hydrolase of the HAD superfamily